MGQGENRKVLPFRISRARSASKGRELHEPAAPARDAFPCWRCGLVGDVPCWRGGLVAWMGVSRQTLKVAIADAFGERHAFCLPSTYSVPLPGSRHGACSLR